jgi:hypothetical protein
MGAQNVTILPSNVPMFSSVTSCDQSEADKQHKNKISVFKCKFQVANIKKHLQKQYITIASSNIAYWANL